MEEEIVDEYGFNEKHLYVNEDGRKTKLNPYGFDYKHRYQGKDGSYHDEFGFNFSGKHKRTFDVYDTHFFDRDGFYYESRDGKYVKTDKKINPECFDREGFYCIIVNPEELDEEKTYYKIPYKKDDNSTEDFITYVRTEYKTNPKGLDIDGIYHEDDVRDVDLLREINKRKAKEEREARKKAETAAIEKEKRLKAIREKEENAKAEEKQKKKEILARREELLEEFLANFDENGICIKTGLPYDEHYFKKNKTNVVTGTSYDIRSFDCLGRCKANEFRMYDRSGYNQDGFYRDTDEKYHNGYNAFGVDKDGKLRNGKVPEEISIGKDYLKAIFEPTKEMNRATFIKNYAIRKGYSVDATVNKLTLMLFTACEMLPDLKDELNRNVENTSKTIQRRRMELSMLKRQQNTNQETINKYNLSIKTLESRLGAVDFIGGER